MPKVSIVVAIYNVEAYVEKCVNSILNQTYRDFELILVNDGSKDNCLAICRSFEAMDERVKVLDKPNGGLSDARNAGMKIAQGKYIFFVDGDDFIEPELLEKCITKLEETDSDMVMFDIYQYYLKENRKEIIANPFDENKVYSLKDCPEMMTKIKNCAWNKIYKLSLFRDNEIEYPKGFYYEDLGTTYRLLLKAEKISFVNVPLYDYLIDRPGNITQQFNQKAYHILDMSKMVLDYYKEQKAYDQYYEELKFLVGVNVMESLKKTRTTVYGPMVKDYIHKCLVFLKENFPEFPKCKYEILREKNDWVYADEFRLNSYLKLRKLMHK